MAADGGGHRFHHAADPGKREGMTFFFRRFAKRKAELDQEIQAYLEMDIHARMKRGESAERARAAAMRELGNVALIDFDAAILG
jgi:hypothetical protein